MKSWWEKRSARIGAEFLGHVGRLRKEVEYYKQRSDVIWMDYYPEGGVIEKEAWQWVDGKSETGEPEKHLEYTGFSIVGQTMIDWFFPEERISQIQNYEPARDELYIDKEKAEQYAQWCQEQPLYRRNCL